MARNDAAIAAANEAHREAGASLREAFPTLESVKTAIAAETPVGTETEIETPEPGPSEPAPEPKSTPEAPDEGTSPAPAPKGDDEPVTDDYDEEAAVVPAADDDDRPKTQPTAQPKTDDGQEYDPQKLRSQYKSEDELLKGFAATKKHSHTQARELADLKAENERLKTGTPAPAREAEPAPATAPVAVNPTTFIKGVFSKAEDQLTDTDRAIRTAARTLSQQKNGLDTQLAAVKDAKAKLDAADVQIQEETSYLRRQKKKAEAHPDDYELEQEIVALESSIKNLTTDKTILRLDFANIENDYRNAHRSHLDNLDSFEAGVSNVIRSQTQEAKARETFTADYKQATTQWSTAFTKTLEAFGLSKLSPKGRKVINDVLLKRAEDAPGDVDDFETWMAAQTDVKEMVSELSRAAQISHNASMRRDAEQPGPRGADAVAPTVRPSSKSIRDIDREAAAQLRRELAGAR